LDTGLVQKASPVTPNSSSRPEVFNGKKICCVVSGGNVDPSVYIDLISA
jgi:threonine dehydratase